MIGIVLWKDWSRYMKNADNCPQRALVPTQSYKSLIRMKYHQDQKIVVIPHGVDLRDFEILERQNDNKRLNILYARAVIDVRIKGLKLLSWDEVADKLAPIYEGV